MKQQNLRTNLLSSQEPKQQEQTPEKRQKKRMTSLKPHKQSSQYKNVITKIFCYHHPIRQNNTLDTECKAEIGFVFIGGVGTLTQQTLKKHQIKAVLTVIDYKKFDKQNISQKVEDIDEIQQHQFIDMPQQHHNIDPYLGHSFDFMIEMLNSGFNVLVHSNEGLSRAPVIVINFIMKTYRLKFDQAYEIVKLRKPEIQLKKVYVEQLSKIVY